MRMLCLFKSVFEVVGVCESCEKARNVEKVDPLPGHQTAKEERLYLQKHQIPTEPHYCTPEEALGYL